MCFSFFLVFKRYSGTYSGRGVLPSFLIGVYVYVKTKSAIVYSIEGTSALLDRAVICSTYRPVKVIFYLSGREYGSLSLESSLGTALRGTEVV